MKPKTERKTSLLFVSPLIYGISARAGKITEDATQPPIDQTLLKTFASHVCNQFKDHKQSFQGRADFVIICCLEGNPEAFNVVE